LLIEANSGSPDTTSTSLGERIEKAGGYVRLRCGRLPGRSPRFLRAPGPDGNAVECI
jgi:hypothetical protein